MVLVSKKEIEMLRENKINEITGDDVLLIVEHKDLLIKWLQHEQRLYQVKLGNLWFVGNSIEAEISIKCLWTAIERLSKVEETVRGFYKAEERKKKTPLDTA